MFSGGFYLFMLYVYILVYQAAKIVQLHRNLNVVVPTFIFLVTGRKGPSLGRCFHPGVQCL